jgi:hypothetical protein
MKTNFVSLLNFLYESLRSTWNFCWFVCLFHNEALTVCEAVHINSRKYVVSSSVCTL